MDFDTRTACYAVITRDDEVLLTHYVTSGGATGWTLPGGGLELGETPDECCLREVFEETGYRVRLDDLATARNHWISAEEREWPVGDRPLQALQLIYRATITSGDLVCEVDGSTDDVRWVRRDEVDGLSSANGWPGEVVRQVLAAEERASGR